MYQREGKAAYKANLNGIKSLCKLLGNPEKNLPCIHVAGTNGKGSTSHMMASILQEAGYKVGLYTSPHLSDFRERIRVNGKQIEKSYVTQFVANNKTSFESVGASFFEWSVALAFDYFFSEETDINVIEVGLGGRLDATNVIQPFLSIITNIGTDHGQFLGTTRQEIAREKAGIIKPETPVIIGEWDDKIQPVFETIAKEKKAPLHPARPINQQVETDLLGAYQQKNLATVLTALDHLPSNFSITTQQIYSGLKHVVKNTGLRGRWQIVSSSPDIILDVAHNKEGLSLIFEQLNKANPPHLHIVWGMVSDKAIKDIIPLLPSDATYYLCAPNVPRAMPIETLENACKSQQLSYSKHATVEDAIQSAMNLITSKETLYIGGSTFVVAEGLDYFNA